MVDRKPISPRELSDRLGQPLSNVSYHIGVLSSSNAIALVDTKPVGGLTQHFYRFDIETDWALEALDADAE